MLGEQKVIRTNVGRFELVRQLWVVSQAEKMMDYSSDSFYRVY